MPQTQYNLHLKGFVGGADFDRNYVDYILAKNASKEVNVLIDSLGGSLATALSIAAAFKNHGKVSVHFVGMNASAATIASLGAAHISIDKNTMYLVHKCSTALHNQGCDSAMPVQAQHCAQLALDFFEWGSLNADQFRTLIADCRATTCHRSNGEETSKTTSIKNRAASRPPNSVGSGHLYSSNSKTPCFMHRELKICRQIQNHTTYDQHEPFAG